MGDPLAAAHCPRCLVDYRAGFEVCGDCGTPLEPGPAPELAERGEVEVVHAASVPTPEAEAPEPDAWEEASARVWGEGSTEPDADAWIDVDEDEVDVDGTGYALVTTAPVLSAFENAERLAEAGIDARVVVRDTPIESDPIPDRAELRVPEGRLEDARRILGLVV